MLYYNGKFCVELYQVDKKLYEIEVSFAHSDEDGLPFWKEPFDGGTYKSFLFALINYWRFCAKYRRLYVSLHRHHG
jgi:hypothetical protein